jgi:4-hydroxyproline epimerase
MTRLGPIEVVDSHTEGEPTRVVIDGWPEPAGRTMIERRETMRREHDHLRRAVVLEPRGHDAIVGAILTPPERPDATAGIVFFNDVSYLGMCGHGLIGVVRTLEFLGRVGPGHLEFDTPVGPVSAELADDGTVTIRNVPSYLHRRDVTLDVPGVGTVTGDIAWGGNWFFLTELADQPLLLSRRAELLRVTTLIRDAITAQGITGADGGLIDHIELFGAATGAGADSRNFVLCPGGAYDRSPCGTGTSAKLATLHGKGHLAIGAPWTQESIVGSSFTGWLEQDGKQLVPHIRGRAFITARSTLLFDAGDPFRHGLG